MTQQAVRFLSERADARPRAAVVLGSGLGGALAGELGRSAAIPYSSIPGWPVPTAAGHSGELYLGLLAGCPVAVLAGRVHLYEGYGASEVVFGVRALGLLGAKTLIVTNAAGGVNPDYGPGNLVLLSDHINLTGANPLTGPNDEALGPRFPAMTEAYSIRLRNLAREAGRKLGVELAEGVYAGLAGPNYETPAEIRMLRSLGADLVGMSTVLEVIAARHMGIETLGISCVTNPAAGLAPGELSHQEVLAVGKRAEKTVTRLIKEIAARL